MLMLAAPPVARGLYVDSYIHRHTGERFLGATQVLANDAIIYVVLLSLFYLSFLKKTPRAVSILLRVLAFGAFLLYAIDVVVMVCFNAHLTVDDTVAYSTYAHKYLAQITRKRHVLILLAGVFAVGLAGWVLVCRYTLVRVWQHVLAGLAVLGLLMAWCFARNDTYIHSWRYKNVVAYTLEVRSESRGYSDGFISGFSFDADEVEEPNTPQTPNIIILMVESLSSYQSQYFSGLYDWMPSLDKIARENVAYTGFYANGFCTNDCYISVLMGRLPLRPPGSGGFVGNGPYSGFEDDPESLPRLLSKQGYATEFLMAGDQGFSGVGDWAKGLGFDTLEGHDHPAYDGWERYHFESAPDEALYARLVERIDQHQQTDGRFFMYVSTMTTHHPFVNPQTGEHSEEQTYRYADRQLGAFHEKLIEMGYFDDGILIILGDHHAMVPLKTGETEAMGEYRAAARVPMVVSYGNRKQAVVAGLHQQADIYHSLVSLTSSQRVTSDWVGDIFNNRPVKYVIHRRGDFRNIVSVFTENEDYLIKLDGDDTRVIGGEPGDDALEAAIVGRVNAARLLELAQE